MSLKKEKHATVRKYTLQLNTVADAEVITYLDEQSNKNDTIRQALLKQMKERKRVGE